jgi:phage host-nuclease inhibitor protein Gam
MSENKTKMKERLSQFVDSLMDDEIKNIHSAIRATRAELSAQIDSVKQEIEKDISHIKRSYSAEIAKSKEDITSIKKDISEIQSANTELIDNKIASMEKTLQNKTTAIDSRMEHIAEDIDNKLDEKISDIHLGMGDMDKRLGQAEKVTHLFGNFAADYSSILQTKQQQEKQSSDSGRAVKHSGRNGSSTTAKKTPKPHQTKRTELEEFEDNFADTPREKQSVKSRATASSSSRKSARNIRIEEEGKNPIVTDETGQQLYSP